MKKTLELIPQLKSYFGATVIGSYLFLEADLISETDINDLDIVPKTGRLNDTKSFLEDNGFQSSDGIRYQNPEYDKPVDVLSSLVAEARTISDLIKFKYERGYLDDLRQLEKVVQSKISKQNGAQ